MVKNFGNKQNKIIILMSVILILAGVILFVLLKSKNMREVDSQINGGGTTVKADAPYSGGKHDIMYYVIGEVEEVLKEEVPILNTVKHRTIGYRMKVRVPLSTTDLAVGDEVEIHSVYLKKGTENNGKPELEAGDIIIVSYFPYMYGATDGAYVIEVEDGSIEYGSIKKAVSIVIDSRPPFLFI